MAGPLSIIIMGVSGCGKSTLGQALARARHSRFLDADDFHPPANIDKMSRGIALNDEDRWPWLKLLADQIRQAQAEGQELVLACSALRQSYRDRLGEGGPCRFVHLTGSRTVLAERLQNRGGHFMAASLLDSQLSTLEPPTDAIQIDIALGLRQQLDQVLAKLG